MGKPPRQETREERRQDIASQNVKTESRGSSINELGGYSGWENSAGGSDGRMEERNSRKARTGK